MLIFAIWIYTVFEEGFDAELLGGLCTAVSSSTFVVNQREHEGRVAKIVFHLKDFSNDTDIALTRLVDLLDVHSQYLVILIKAALMNERPAQVLSLLDIYNSLTVSNVVIK